MRLAHEYLPPATFPTWNSLMPLSSSTVNTLRFAILPPVPNSMLRPVEFSASSQLHCIHNPGRRAQNFAQSRSKRPRFCTIHIEETKILHNPDRRDQISDTVELDSEKHTQTQTVQLFLAALYSSKADETSLDQIRYEIFSKSLTKPTFELASLPPTNAAAAQHILLVYLQI
ncbi:hypothetical protein JTB14_018985 [Gonioctena quinquepunctata]|nr:hypothetical protein JTB14_018985 [Gonioctena quinquepunctata]